MKKMLFVIMLVSAITLNAQVSKGSITGTNGNFRNYTFTQVAPAIRDYQVVESKDIKSLTEKVKSLIQQGWVPYGPATAVLSYGGDLAKPIYIQTMVKY